MIANAPMRDARPNILFILTDQQRSDALGAMSPWMKTPGLDRLATEGTLFTRCVTQSPGCIPARVSLMTGLYPHNTGVWHSRAFTLPPDARVWVRNIRAAGYRTSIVGKTHLHAHHGDIRDGRPLVEAWGFDDVIETSGPRASATTRSDMTDEWERLDLWDAYKADLNERQGENRFVVRPSPLGFEHHYDTFVGRKAADQITTYAFDRPWFCWVGFGGPHEPWDAPEPYFGLYPPEEVPPPLPPMKSPARNRPRGLLLDDRVASDTARLSGLSPENLAAVRANYAGKVSLIDHHITELLDVVEERGELDRTVVVFASDHGEMNGDHGLFHKSCFLEPAVTVPLLIRLPERFGNRGRVIEAPVELIDVGPTLAEAAGAPVDYPQWGRSLWPLLQEETTTARDFAVSEQRGEIMACSEKWKVALNQEGAAYLCTDLKGDPGELVNLAGTRAGGKIERMFRDRLMGFLLGTQLFDDWRSSPD